jgi:hypothetical protein
MVQKKTGDVYSVPGGEDLILMFFKQPLPKPIPQDLEERC